MVFGLGCFGKKKDIFKSCAGFVARQAGRQVYIHILIDMMIYDVMLNNTEYDSFLLPLLEITITMTGTTKQPVESRNEQHHPYAAKHWNKPGESSSPAQSTCAASQQPYDPVAYPQTPAGSSPH